MTFLLGIGGNLAPEQSIPAAVAALTARWPGLRRSTFHWTRPFGPGTAEQPPFVNGVVLAESAELPVVLRAWFRELEEAAGRVRDPRDKFAPRPLDLDLLTWGDLADPAQGLPAADLVSRDFVLLPAAELCPHWRHPVLGQTLAELAAARFPAPPAWLGEFVFP